MKTKLCKYCNTEVAKNAKVCPSCGGKLGMPGWLKVLIIFGIIILCFVGCVAGCTKSVADAVDESLNAYDDINGKTSFNVNDTFESKVLKIEFKEVNKDFKGYSEYAAPAKENKVVKFSFTAENIGEEEQSFSSYDFECYADGKAEDKFIFSNDAKDGTNTMSKGKKADLNVYCEVPKSAKEVSVEYKPILAKKAHEFKAY